MENIIKILHVNIDNKNQGGAFQLIHNIDKCIADKEIEFYYLTMDSFVGDGDMNLERTFSANLRNNKIFGHIMLPIYVKKILENNHFDAIHLNVDSSWKALLYAWPASKYNVPIITHSHSIGSDGSYKLLKNCLHRIYRKKIIKYTDVQLACSKEAAEWMFGNSNHYKLLFNGIDVKKFVFNEKIRESSRRALNIQDEFVLGNVGSLSYVKNQKFLLDVIREIVELGYRVKLLLIGGSDPKWKNIIEKKILKEKLSESVVLYGSSSKVNELLCAMDVFLLPSKFEGCPISLVEAQVSGLPCLISNTIPDAAIVSSNVKKLPIEDATNESVKHWVREIETHIIEKDRYERKSVIDSRCDIKNTASELCAIYYELMRS